MKTTFNKKLCSIVLSTLLLVGIVPTTALADENTATSMKVASTEGKVTITNGLGRKMSPFNGMNLSNGQHVLTDKGSNAKINMDDTKLATVGELSDVDISKQDDDLELHLNSGDVCVAVNKKIDKTATVKIRRANVVMGVVGTIISAEAKPDETVVVFGSYEGTGQVSSTNLITGETQTTSVGPGEIVRSTTEQTQDGQTKVNMTKGSMEQSDVPSSVPATAQDPNINDRIENATGGAIDPNDSSQNQANRQQAIESAGGTTGDSTDGTDGVKTDGIISANDTAEKRLQQEEADALAALEKDDDDDDDDDEEPAAVHRHTFARPHEVYITEDDGFYIYFQGDGPGRECMTCHQEINHVLTLTKEPDPEQEDYTYSWSCSCGETGSGELG